MFAFVYHFIEATDQHALERGDHGFFTAFWGIYSFTCIMVVSTFYPGAAQYVDDYFTFVKDQVDETREAERALYEDPTISVNKKRNTTLPPTDHSSAESYQKPYDYTKSESEYIKSEEKNQEDYWDHDHDKHYNEIDQDQHIEMEEQAEEDFWHHY